MAAFAGRPVLVATLGTNPQVVTLAVDMLAEDEHCEVGDVYVIHTEPTGWIGQAVSTLRDAFANGNYRGRPCNLHLVEIRTKDDRAVPDIRSEVQAHAAFQAIFGTVRARKQAQETVNLCIAGGRNSMVVYGAAAAHILFDSYDRLWHIISEPEFERERRLHRLRKRDAQLVEVPVISWTAWLNHTVALWTDDPFEAYRMQRSLRASLEDRVRTAFYDQLSTQEKRVLAAFVDTTAGGSNRQIADVVFMSRRTVEGHFVNIYEKMMNHLDLPHDMQSKTKRTTLLRWFSGFFELHPELRPSFS